MRYRLRRHEKEELRKRYKDNVIYKAFTAPCKKYEAQPAGFRLSPEELFWECMTVLDDIKENPEEAPFSMQEFWSDKVADYRELDGDVAHESIEQTATLVTLSVMLCLAGQQASLYNELSLMLSCQLPLVVDMREHLTANIYRLGEDKFNDAVATYMDSDEFISDDIEDLLAELPQPMARVVNGQLQKEEEISDRLSIRQLVILFEQALNISLDSAFTNISALATLIEKVSGYKASSIRTSINDLAKRGYDSASVRNDIDRLVTLVEKVKPQLSEQLRNTIKD